MTISGRNQNASNLARLLGITRPNASKVGFYVCVCAYNILTTTVTYSSWALNGYGWVFCHARRQTFLVVIISVCVSVCIRETVCVCVWERGGGGHCVRMWGVGVTLRFNFQEFSAAYYNRERQPIIEHSDTRQCGCWYVQACVHALIVQGNWTLIVFQCGLLMCYTPLFCVGSFTVSTHDFLQTPCQVAFDIACVHPVRSRVYLCRLVVVHWTTWVSRKERPLRVAADCRPCFETNFPELIQLTWLHGGVLGFFPRHTTTDSSVLPTWNGSGVAVCVCMVVFFVRSCVFFCVFSLFFFSFCLFFLLKKFVCKALLRLSHIAWLSMTVLTFKL